MSPAIPMRRIPIQNVGKRRVGARFRKQRTDVTASPINVRAALLMGAYIVTCTPRIVRQTGSRDRPDYPRWPGFNWRSSRDWWRSLLSSCGAFASLLTPIQILT
jgi:hypothetical protein